MSEKLRNKGKEFAKFMEGLSEEEINAGNEAGFRRAELEHKRFREAFNKDNCYLCEKPHLSFSKNTPCIHWLLKPKGFKKKYFNELSEKYGIFQIQSYLRWVANENTFAKNINDLVTEGTSNKIIELTIKYKNLEWSFSCAESDYIGHAKSKHSKHPHYHFQMRINEKPFINFNDFHPPLSKMDVINLEAMRSNPEKVRQRFSFGEGMNDMFNEEIIEHVLDSPSVGENDENAAFSIGSMVYASEGGTIDGDALYSIIEEAKEKGVTIASMLHKLPNSTSKTIVSPGPGVVEQAPRSGRKKP